MCIFYASKYHLSVVLLEYLKNKNTKKYTVNTFLENEIKDEINILKQKYKINIYSANEINFENTIDIKNKKIDASENMIFIIEGNYSYIKEANKYLKEKIENYEYENVKIINCFSFEDQKNFMEKILLENDKILYTTGEKVID